MSYKEYMPRRAREWGPIPADGGLAGGFRMALVICFVIAVAAFIIAGFVT